MKTFTHVTTSVLLILMTSRCLAVNPAGILADSGVKGGLIVVVGCDDPDLITGLCNGPFVVHALDSDSKKVAKARDFIQAKGLYGKASAAVWSGETLPYVDNLVNLLIDESGKGKAASKEGHRHRYMRNQVSYQ